jgi:hypothetical protein
LQWVVPFVEEEKKLLPLQPHEKTKTWSRRMLGWSNQSFAD